MPVQRKTRARRRRRPGTGGYARGERVRARILAAAAELFANEGYEAASTRRIAAAAGVNAPALQYYFGGKASLHIACGRQCCDWFEDGLHAELSYAKTVVAARDGRAAHVALRRLLMAMLAHAQSDRQAALWNRFLGRLQYDSNGPAVAAVSERMLQSLFKVCAELAALTQGRTTAKAQDRLVAMVLIALPAAFISAHGGALWRARGGLSASAVKAMVRQMFSDQVSAALRSATALTKPRPQPVSQLMHGYRLHPRG
jgi:TetR/AcrR family transcriptional regulator, regulator of cefoperazone and chloramphenicol sensitivity